MHKHISTIDADGVALAAIQGLRDIVKGEDEKMLCLEKEDTEPEGRLGALEELVKRFTDHQGEQQ